MLTKIFINTQLAVKKFKNDQRGVTAIEYAIIGVAVSAIVLAFFGSGGLDGAMSAAMTKIVNAINPTP